MTSGPPEHGRNRRPAASGGGMGPTTRRGAGVLGHWPQRPAGQLRRGRGSGGRSATGRSTGRRVPGTLVLATAAGGLGTGNRRR